jgi:hypothetical protein
VSRAWTPLLLVLLMPGSVLSDSSNLEGGVFIAHHPPGLQYTDGQDRCARYFQEFAIDSCSEQNTRIDLDGNEGRRSAQCISGSREEAIEALRTERGMLDSRLPRSTVSRCLGTGAPSLARNLCMRE